MLPKLQPQKEILVDGTKYIVQLYEPEFGLTLYFRLLSLLGEPIIKLINMFKGEKTQGKSIKDLLTDGSLKFDDIDTDTLADSLAMLFGKLPKEEFVPLLKEVISGTFTDKGQPVNDQFSTLFMGRYLHMFKLVGKSLVTQYPDFLSGLAKRAKGVNVAPATQEEKATG